MAKKAAKAAKKQEQVQPLYGRIKSTYVEAILKGEKTWQPRRVQSSLSSGLGADGISHVLQDTPPASKALQWLTVRVDFPPATDVQVAGKLEPIKGWQGFWRFTGGIPDSWLTPVKTIVQKTYTCEDVSREDALAWAKTQANKVKPK